MNSSVQRYLVDLVQTAREVLGDDLIGAYAGGSIGLDAYELGRSDIDVALVCEDAWTMGVNVNWWQDCATRSFRARHAVSSSWCTAGPSLSPARRSQASRSN